MGAGGAYSGGTWPYGDLQKLAFSSYGSRFDLQGWGENVYTTGYGDLYSADGTNYYYTHTFSGTSSASPIVAGALACAEGYYLANVSATPPTPAFMRTHLKTYGTAQVTPPSGNIGPRPNLYLRHLSLPLPWPGCAKGLRPFARLRRRAAPLRARGLRPREHGLAALARVNSREKSPKSSKNPFGKKLLLGDSLRERSRNRRFRRFARFGKRCLRQ